VLIAWALTSAAFAQAPARRSVVDGPRPADAVALERRLVAAAPPVAPPATPPATMAFEAREGERLSVALTRFLAARGWELEWSAPVDFVVERAYQLPLGDAPLNAALLQVLVPFRLSAVLHDAPPQRVVDVKAAEPAVERGS
jgi:hypothetical protein